MVFIEAPNTPKRMMCNPNSRSRSVGEEQVATVVCDVCFEANQC